MHIILWLSIVLLILGTIFACIELIIPGFGLAGITSIICFVFGITLIPISMPVKIILAIAILIGLIALAVIILNRISKKMPKAICLDTQLDESFKCGSDYSNLVGKTGVAKTDLRPSGTVVIDGKSYDVVTEDGYVVKGTNVKVEEVKSLKILVKPFETHVSI